MLKVLTKLGKAEHVTIVALGDSNTEITFHTKGGMNWVGLLSEAIFETYGNGVCTLINSGKCGSSYEESLTRLDRDVGRFCPDLVILALGMNDAARGRSYLDTFEANVRKVIEHIQRSSGSEILLCTPNPVVTVHGLPLPAEQHLPGKPWESDSRPLAEYVDVLVGTGKEMNIQVVNHYAAWVSKTFSVKHPVADPTGLWPRMSDAIHPGFSGHVAFFRELAPFFEVPKYFSWEEVEQQHAPDA